MHKGYVSLGVYLL